VADVLTLPIRTIVRSTPLTRVIRLNLGDIPFAFHAGQAANIGLHGQSLRRPYSIASAPDDTSRYGRLEFLIKVDAQGLAGLHLDGMTPGSRIDLEGPFGSFTMPPQSDASSFLFVAGGTGISPMRSIWRQLDAAGDRRPIAVLYSARTSDEFAYAAELKRMARRRGISLAMTVTGAVPSQWEGVSGRIGREQLARALPSTDPMCFLCGPQSLVDDVSQHLRQIGLPPARIRTEEW